MMSRHSSISSARMRRSHSSPKVSKPESMAPRPTDNVTRPFDSRSTVATWLASSHGRRRDGGVSSVPSRILRRAHGGEAERDPRVDAPHRLPHEESVPSGLLGRVREVTDVVGVAPRDHEAELHVVDRRPHRESVRQTRQLCDCGQTRVDDRRHRARRQGLDLGARAAVPGVRVRRRRRSTRPPSRGMVREQRRRVGRACSTRPSSTCARRPDP